GVADTEADFAGAAPVNKDPADPDRVALQDVFDVGRDLDRGERQGRRVEPVHARQRVRWSGSWKAGAASVGKQGREDGGARSNAQPTGQARRQARQSCSAQTRDRLAPVAKVYALCHEKLAPDY